MTWSGSARASASSRASSRWVSATCRSTAPISASAARAPAIGSRNWTAGAGRGGGEPQAGAAEPLDPRRPRAAEGRAAPSLEDVRAKPDEARLVHALAEHGGAEIELVVAEGRRIQPQEVPGLHHLASLERGRHQRGRQGVPGQREERVGTVAPDFPDLGGQAGEAPAALGRRLERVYVIHGEQRDPDALT